MFIALYSIFLNMKRTYDISTVWDTEIRDEEYMFIFEADSKKRAWDRVIVKNQVGEKGVYIVLNTYLRRLCDVVEDDVIFQWYFSNLVEHALWHDEKIPFYNRLAGNMEYEKYRDHLKTMLKRCILSLYKEPYDRVVRVVIATTPSRYYGNGDNSIATDPFYYKVHKLLEQYDCKD